MPNRPQPSQSVSLAPTYAELWRRIELADDFACDGMSGPTKKACRYCEEVVKALRGGEMYCPYCRHLNMPLHSCEDWKAYDAGEMTSEQINERWKAREAALLGGTQGNVQTIVAEHGS